MENIQAKKRKGFNIKTFIMEESLGGFLLIAVTIVAVIWANSNAYEFYNYLWHEMKLGISLGDWELKGSLNH